MSPAAIITLSTLRIECHASRGKSIGTGFLFNFHVGDSDSKVTAPVIVTNKHVVDGATSLHTTVSLMPKGTKEQVREDCTATSVEHRTIVWEGFQSAVESHPEASIDICAIPIAGFLGPVLATHELRHAFLDESWLPSQEVRQLLRPIETVVMVGYPNGLWDAVNNLPIIRSGLTGSHPLLDWNGQPQFIVDAACFPGSSGSPVFLFEDGMYRSGTNSYSPGTRVCLLGILWGGPLISLEGRIEQRQIPTGTSDVPVINSMMNLGFVHRADALLAIKKGLQDRFTGQPT